MTKRHAAGTIRGLVRLTGAAVLCLRLMLGSSVPPALAEGVIWYVTRATDSASDGDLPTRSGSLRFILSHARSGDFVSFDQLNPHITAISVASPLTVPEGVTIGHTRYQDCGSYTTPLVNLEDTSFSVKPILRLGAGSTLRNLNLGGGDISLEITGPDVDVCAVGLGVEYFPQQSPFPYALPPKHAALIIDAVHATLHRSFVNGAMVVTTRGSDSRIGDTITGSDEGNQGGCGNQGRCPVTISAEAAGAAQRVTVRDPFPRALAGLVGAGVPGGDDDPTHANNWAQTPTLLSAYTYDDFTTVQVRGAANPLSLVDIYFDNQITLVRQPPVMADATGNFSFSGPLPGRTIEVFAVSTLNDSAYLGRVGSSSQFSQSRLVVKPPGVPLLSALGSVTNLSGPPGGPAHPGDVLRFGVAMTNVGAVDVTNINSSALSIPTGLAVVSGSGAMQGDGVGFVATDSGFSGGALAPGGSATYSLDVQVTPAAQTGVAVFSVHVNADAVVSIPVIGRIRIEPPLQPVVWLPLIVKGGDEPAP